MRDDHLGQPGRDHLPQDHRSLSGRAGQRSLPHRLRRAESRRRDLKIDQATHHNELDILFTAPEVHSRGIGYGAWQAVEALHPEPRCGETFTPYFEKRNIHFYLNKCGFKIVEFFTTQHPLDLPPQNDEEQDGPDEMFRFVKVME